MLLLGIICNIYFLANGAVHITWWTAENGKLQIKVLVWVWDARKMLTKKKNTQEETTTPPNCWRGEECSVEAGWLLSLFQAFPLAIGWEGFLRQVDSERYRLVHCCALYSTYVQHQNTSKSLSEVTSEFYCSCWHDFYLCRCSFLYCFSEFNFMSPNSTGGRTDSAVLCTRQRLMWG